ncbi:DUF4937 domain-containing protein [Kitasatospora sp. NPDC057692]|uniref:DUF4937 domain-containing protein n=1 Tax=Kitasatospora sp. NPDC057692 TaxID=3346215 RepID=UPI0036D19BFE
MWGKWISCEVPPGDGRERFSDAQRAWSVIGDQPGLVGQVGGWDPDAGRARLLGLWEDAEAYGRFMRERHDAVLGASGQDGTFTAIGTAAGAVVLEMPGDATGLPRALETAALLRVADCRLRPGRTAHFLAVQREVWAPGMAAAGGMLGGVVIRLDPQRYLVTTLWSGPAAHRRYAVERLPALLERAAIEDDLGSLTGHLVPLEPDWTVLPVRPRRGPR